MKPVWISMEDYKKDNEHVYAVCHCTFISTRNFRVIQLNKQPGKTRYRFWCEDCGVTGEVIDSGEGWLMTNWSEEEKDEHRRMH